MAEKKMPVIESVEMDRVSPFDIKNVGVMKKDPNKDYRWVDPKRIDERKFGHGFRFVALPEDAQKTADGTVRTKGGMVLMERPKELAEESTRRKEALTRSRSKAAREVFRNDVEEMSRRVGKDLHKYVTDEEDQF